MNINPAYTENDLDEQKTMKVQLSKRHHILLHSLKICTGRTISEITGDALELYYEAEGADLEATIDDI